MILIQSLLMLLRMAIDIIYMLRKRSLISHQKGSPCLPQPEFILRCQLKRLSLITHEKATIYSTYCWVPTTGEIVPQSGRMDTVPHFPTLQPTVLPFAKPNTLMKIAGAALSRIILTIVSFNRLHLIKKLAYAVCTPYQTVQCFDQFVRTQSPNGTEYFMVPLV